MATVETDTRQRVLGYLDVISDRRIFGWAFDRARPEDRVEIHVHDGERPLGTVIADQPREDLASGGIGAGNHAFAFDLPPEVAARPDDVRVIARLGTGEMVPLANRVRDADTDADLRKLVRRLVELTERSENAQRRLARTANATVAAFERHLEAERPDVGVTAALLRVENRLKELAEEVRAVDRSPWQRAVAIGVWIVVGMLLAQIVLKLL